MSAPSCWQGCGLLLALTLAATLLLAAIIPALALEPPPPGMIDQMQASGDMPRALAFAEKLGNHKVKAALRGTPVGTSNPQGIADLIGANIGRSLDLKGAKAVSEMTTSELSWVELDLNHDRTVDERDVLALGQPSPKVVASYPSLGTVKTFCLIIDFSDYPSYFAKSVFETNLFGDGDSYYSWYKGLKYYYGQASYSQLTVDGTVYGWYRAAHPRTYYHPNDSNDYPSQWELQEDLVWEAITAANTAGADFSQYDNDGDSKVDYFLVIWTGPHGAWASFWWGYYGVGLPTRMSVDGVTFPSFSWQWERYYGFAESPPALTHWDPLVTIHETGHALGLPDYYDYNGNVGPDGGCGGLDMMDYNRGDHNCFSKYILGWLTPTVAFNNLNDEQLQKSNAYGDPVIFMQGFDPVSPWSEFFIAQNRYKEGVDNNGYYSNGMLLWHVDARVDRNGYAQWDNSYTSHKMLRLMEADGLEEIEQNLGANAGDFYDNTASTGDDLTASSTPNSNKYDGTVTNIVCDDISASGVNMTADFTLYSSTPPDVSITAPSAGATVSGNATTVTVAATGGGTITKVQLLIDNLLVKEWTSWSSPQSYTWNTLVDFNGTRSITARAWGDGSVVGSATISVTVSNTGVTSQSDDFESGLGLWRVENIPIDSRGQQTVWDVRTSPANPTPKLSNGNEAWVKPANSTSWFTAADILRTQRINATGYTRAMQVKFFYRSRTNFSIWKTADNGASWQRLEVITPSSGWFTYNRQFAFNGSTVYLALRYEGSIKENDNNGLGANIDSFIARELPGSPPSASFSSPSNGASVSGSTDFTVSASDSDGTVGKVYFFVNDSLVYTDDVSPWVYSRNTLNDDDNPGVHISAYAEDNDGLPSSEALITVVFNNDRPYPVTDDLESGSGNWTFSNDSFQPQWQLVTDSGHSGTQCIGYVTATGWELDNNDGTEYRGDPPSSGRQCIDLNNASVDDPVLRFWYKMDVPSGSTLSLYWSDTWIGSQRIGGLSGDQASWTEASFDLWPYSGYSGRISFWTSNATTNGATGIWIDDVRVENRGPTITGITPARGIVGVELNISGSGFGVSRGSNYVTFSSGVQAQPSDYVSWSNNSIHVKIPSGAVSGNVTVTIGSQTTNGVNVAVILAPPNLGGVGQL